MLIRRFARSALAAGVLTASLFAASPAASAGPEQGCTDLGGGEWRCVTVGHNPDCAAVTFHSGGEIYFRYMDCLE